MHIQGEPHWEDQYSVIGSGSTEALAFLAQNDFDETEIKLEECLFRVAEAMNFSSIANNTVGASMRFEILIYQQGSFDVTTEFFNFIKSNRRLAAMPSFDDVGEFLEREEESEESEETESSSKEAEATESTTPEPLL